MYGCIQFLYTPLQYKIFNTEILKNKWKCSWWVIVLVMLKCLLKITEREKQNQLRMNLNGFGITIDIDTEQFCDEITLMISKLQFVSGFH